MRWVAALVLATACGRSGSTRATPTSATGPLESGVESVPEPMDDRERAQWEAAKDGEPEELMRLEDLVGCAGLQKRARAEPRLGGKAVRAMRYCSDCSELPWLAAVAAGADEAEARAALESVAELAARPRRATDPEDAQELHDGCAALLALARAGARPRERRA